MPINAFTGWGLPSVSPQSREIVFRVHQKSQPERMEATEAGG